MYFVSFSIKIHFLFVCNEAYPIEPDPAKQSKIFENNKTAGVLNV